MRAVVTRSSVEGVVKAPPSKSYTHRALVCSALASGRSLIFSPCPCRDTEATINTLNRLSIEIVKHSPLLWEVNGGTLRKTDAYLDCEESGTTLRFISALCSLTGEEFIVSGSPSLLKRPVGELVNGLRQLGAECSCSGGFPPVFVKGKLRGGEARIRGDVSSQFVSALLLAAPAAEKEVHLTLTTKPKSKPYILMTLSLQSEFGIRIESSRDLTEFWVGCQSYKARSCRIEGDWSSASYFLAAGALTGRVKVKGLKLDSLQADKEILDVLRQMGAKVATSSNEIIVEGSSRLEAVEFEVSDCPDLFPLLAVLCAVARGRSLIRGVERVRFKESDRVEAVVEGLVKMGIKALYRNGHVVIEGSKPKGAVIDPRNDHRIAMAFAILGLTADGETIIENAECVSKSFPDFWGKLESLKASLKIMP
ncbi:MAG: 3-phosphoshikimate 1-carboxyvinyltransferase [Candidatus Hecatellales archaeon]|nr:MAG: 3-phosphoshikimate 1-carboxyvinyltransferase [Candidatus Hecatellales archaeon]